MKKNTLLEMVNSPSQKITQFILVVMSALMVQSLSAQVVMVTPGIGNSLDPADYMGGYGPTKRVDVDIDGDGINDFNFSELDVAAFPGVIAFGFNKVNGATNGHLSTPHVSGFFETTEIGAITDVVGAGSPVPPVIWSTNNDQILFADLTPVGLGPTGNYPPGTTGDVMVRFEISGVIHYGWVSITYTAFDDWKLNGWGYEQTAGADATIMGLLNIEKNEFASDVIVYSEDNRINIKNLPEEVDYSLYSLTGQEVQRGVAEAISASFQAPKLSSGVYILKAVGKESGKLLTAKVPIQ